MIKKYGVIGDPIEHSLSPIIHKEFSDHFGIQLQYEKYLVKDNQLSDFINQSKSSFWAGLNLTIPHKIKAIDCVDELDLSAIEAGAINTIHFYDGKLRSQITSMGTDTILSVRDGDSSVTKLNKNEIAKSIASVKDQEYKELQLMIATYKSTQASPRQVAGDDTSSLDTVSDSSSTNINRVEN